MSTGNGTSLGLALMAAGLLTAFVYGTFGVDGRWSVLDPSALERASPCAQARLATLLLELNGEPLRGGHLDTAEHACRRDAERSTVVAAQRAALDARGSEPADTPEPETKQ